MAPSRPWPTSAFSYTSKAASTVARATSANKTIVDEDEKTMFGEEDTRAWAAKARRVRTTLLMSTLKHHKNTIVHITCIITCIKFVRGAPEGEVAAASPAKWACDWCTYLNPPSNAICGICSNGVRAAATPLPGSS